MVKVISVQRIEVPTFLREGDFFKSLNEEDDEAIFIPEHTYKTSLHLQTVGDVQNLLYTLRFWCVTHIPSSLIEFALKHEVNEFEGVFKEFEKDLTYLSFLKVLKSTSQQDRLVFAAKSGILDAVKYLHGHGSVLTKAACEGAASNGHLHCLKYLHENKCQWDQQTCTVAAEAGFLDCLTYAHKHGCPMSADTCAFAALRGQLACLRYAHTHGCNWNESTCYYAAQNGHLECLKYAHENKCPWNTVTCTYAAVYGHLPCLQYAHEHNCAWDEFTCNKAAQNGHYDCLKYAALNGCPIREADLMIYNRNCL